MYILGQVLGLIGTAVTIATPQFRTKIQMLLCNAFVNVLNALSFAMVGQAGSAVYLCLIAVVQSFVSVRHERKRSAASIWETLLFFVLYAGFGFYGMVSSDGFVWAITVHNLLELLPIVGAVMLMFSVFAKGEQKTRAFLLLNGAAWLIYTAAIGSTVFFTSAASIASIVFALWKYRKMD